MAKKSPLQRVREEHGSKEELAEKVLGLLEKPEDEWEAEDFDHRIRTLSNRKLLRLWESHQKVQEQYGSKSDLVEKIVKARFPGGNDDYETKISGFTLPKLLDLARRFKV
ncbi:hypothetical protein FIV42_14790 [Persicimonas caeni]|jgi:hypothetical protein|uniref:Uncharacterized protein n=1 Tax=Persicimonas caeni TaxID=2292766 RepID=A0A4Y6PV22_PERCE|nr:hypothetical protein [Persicimonas caeni]QDG51959.1 hypothetical protein FIV42_14790 [Persicimonas caeni]QED33180.1 hypothetical protein FRD00_14785 [Persicimonas caeni]